MNFKQRVVASIAATAASLAMFLPVEANAAALLGQTPDASVIVTRGNLEWVYASPCAGIGGCSSVQLHSGFGYATDAQWNASFANLVELAAGFTGANGAICAATYFDTLHNHCDFVDIGMGYIWNSPLAPDAQRRTAAVGETFLVRVVQDPGNQVPEPASAALIGLGLLGLSAARRRLKA